MQASHATVLNTLTRVQWYLDASAASLGTVNQSGYRTVLDDVVSSLTTYATKQTTSKRVELSHARSLNMKRVRIHRRTRRVSPRSNALIRPSNRR